MGRKRDTATPKCGPTGSPHTQDGNGWAAKETPPRPNAAQPVPDTRKMETDGPQKRHRHAQMRPNRFPAHAGWKQTGRKTNAATPESGPTATKHTQDGNGWAAKGQRR
ncbi:hypothetical protein CGLUCO_01990 [Corynebacterium glucuronolyticum DSM 44120]|nr:hypothetical protein CGLUCO_01990 [Corynebacterium glucuronolyticum DSM 44120]